MSPKKKFFKYMSAILIGPFLWCLMMFCSTPNLKLNSEQQGKILESMVVLEQHPRSRSPYFEATPAINRKSTQSVRPGEIEINLANSGFTPGSRYRLFRTLTGNSSSLFMYNVIARENGELAIQDEQAFELKNVNILIFGHMLGEESAFTLMSEDGKTFLTTIAVPKPIITQGPDQVTMRVRLWSKTAELVLLQCYGLKPNEELYLLSTSYNEVMHSEGKANADGLFQQVTNPRVKGHQGGEGSYTLFRKNGDVLKAKYLWGEEAIKTARV